MMETPLRMEMARRLRTGFVSAGIVFLLLFGLLLLTRPASPAGPAAPAPAGVTDPGEQRGGGSAPVWDPQVEAPAAPNPVFLKVLQKVLLVLGLICLLVWGLLKLLRPLLGGLSGSAGGRPLLRVLQRQALGPGKAVHLVEAAGKYLLLAETTSSLTVLAELSPEEVEAARETAPGGKQPGPAPGGSETYRRVLRHYLSVLPGFGGSER